MFEWVQFYQVCFPAHIFFKSPQRYRFDAVTALKMCVSWIIQSRDLARTSFENGRFIRS